VFLQEIIGEWRNLKKLFIFTIVAILMSFTVATVFAAPWVYPASETSPTTSEYWATPLTAGTYGIDLVVWNHANKATIGPYVYFVIAIKSGEIVTDFTINNVKVNNVPVPAALITYDLSGTTTPDHFSPGDIFPCDWYQYKIATTLTEWTSPDGWQGTADTSGVAVHIDITVVNPANVKLYFLAWAEIPTEPYYVNSPYSHITTTYNPPDHVIPEVPLGPVMATASMIAAFGAYFGTRKRNFR
jgi:hypothetical protein